MHKLPYTKRIPIERNCRETESIQYFFSFQLIYKLLCSPYYMRVELAFKGFTGQQLENLQIV